MPFFTWMPHRLSVKECHWRNSRHNGICRLWLQMPRLCHGITERIYWAPELRNLKRDDGAQSMIADAAIRGLFLQWWSGSWYAPVMGNTLSISRATTVPLQKNTSCHSWVKPAVCEHPGSARSNMFSWMFDVFSNHFLIISESSVVTTQHLQKPLCTQLGCPTKATSHRFQPPAPKPHRDCILPVEFGAVDTVRTVPKYWYWYHQILPSLRYEELT